MSKYKIEKCGCLVVFIESKSTLTTYMIRYNDDDSFTINTWDYSSQKKISPSFRVNEKKTKAFVDNIYTQDCDAQIIPKICNFNHNIEKVISSFTGE